MFKNVQTTEDYWDCECVGIPQEYIHPKSQLLCTECGQLQEDMPDSRVEEVELAKISDRKTVLNSDGFPICYNDCANWPQTTSNTTFGCACECHN